jgi:hypothetical protein
MRKKTISIVLIAFLLTQALTLSSFTYAVTDDEIAASIESGIQWLSYGQWTGDDTYPADGGWGYPEEWERTAMTGFALIKLQERAYELGYDSPFDPEYEYSDQIIAGWEYIFSVDEGGDPLYVVVEQLSPQDHTEGASGSVDDPDTNGNGYGIGFVSLQASHHLTYTTGVLLMALESSGTPDRENDGGLDFNGDGDPDTFIELAQDAVDWLAYGQVDAYEYEGGWTYDTVDNSGSWADNSNGGYASLGLGAGEDMGCIVPAWVKVELSRYIDYIQNDQGPHDDHDWNDDDPDGGSGYGGPEDWVNILKTGSLIYQMGFVGDAQTTDRFQNAMDYIERRWLNDTKDPGWGYGMNPSHYQAMFCLMRGFEYNDIDMIDLDGDDIPEHDWCREFAEVIVDQQHYDGKWMGHMYGNDILSTCWALLTLERLTPAPIVELDVDIKPGSWPNPINVKSNGVVSVAICGTDEFDVHNIITESVYITKEGYSAGVERIRWSYEDAATPYTGPPNTGHKRKKDGYVDLVLKFRVPGLVDELDLDLLEGSMPLVVKGAVVTEDGVHPFEGEDWVRIINHAEIIEIGVTSASSPGMTSVNAMVSMAEEDINDYCREERKDYRFKYVIRDNGGQDELALENLEHFNDAGINLVVGHDWSGQCSYSLDYANDNDMLMLSPSSTSPYLTDNPPAYIGDNLYRLVPTEEFAGVVLADLYEFKELEAVAILYRDDWWSEAVYEKVLEYMDEDIEVIYELAVPFGADYVPILEHVEDVFDA